MRCLIHLLIEVGGPLVVLVYTYSLVLPLFYLLGGVIVVLIYKRRTVFL
jgi:hypothetical protein